MLEITIILTVISAATCGIFLAKGFHGCFTVSSLLTTILAECLACMVITENSCLWVIYTCVAMFFYYQTIKGWEAYKSRKPNRVYKDYKEIPQGVYYIRTQQGTFKTIPQECVSVYSRQGATVMQNKLTPKPTGTEDTAQWEQHLDRRTVNAICNMLRHEKHTIGYDPQTPLGEIARVARMNWYVRRTSDCSYTEWLEYADVKPTQHDATERGEILVQTAQGDYTVCDVNETIKRDDGTVDLFNGDIFVTPRRWCRIVEPAQWNITRFPNIPLDPKTRNRITKRELK